MTTKTKLIGAAAAAALLVQAGAVKTMEIPETAKARVFLQITKVNAQDRTIAARITDETVDAAGEICDYETSAPLFKKWSENAEKISAGKSKGNVRAMHGPTAAGKLTDISFDDATKAIECVIKVVDENEWIKVDEGVYTGVSLGGNYVGKKWRDADTNAWRYTVDPVEVSLVDLPCNESATFKAVGLDGVEVEKAFHPWEPAKADVEALAVELHKAAGTEGTLPPDFLEAARAELVAKRLVEEVPVDGEPTPEPAVEKVAGAEGETEVVVETPAATDWGVDQVFRCKADNSVHETKKDALGHIEKLQAVESLGGADLLAQAIAKARKAVAGETTEAGEPGARPTVKIEGLDAAVACLKVIAPQIEANPVVAVTKGLWDASRAMEVLSSVCSLANCAAWEADWEGDNSKVPGMLADAARSLGEAALAYCNEEIAEAMAALPELDIADAVEGMDVVVVELARTGLTAVKANTAVVQKVGARNAKADAKRIQAIHDAAKELGGDCDVEKVEGAEVTKVIAERDVLKAQIAEALPAIAELTSSVEKMKGDLDKANAEIKKFSEAPAAMPTIQPGGTVVTRTETPESQLTPEQAQKAVEAIVAVVGTDGLARMAMKAAQTTGIKVGGAS